MAARRKKASPTRFSARRQPASYKGAVNRRGSDNYQSKLREVDVTRAKAAFDRGATVGELATRFGVHASTMSRALRGLTFTHVKGNKTTRGAKRPAKKSAAKRPAKRGAKRAKGSR